jgi:hypothetical protein
MGKLSRTKGKKGELEIITVLKSKYPDAKRELDQFQESLTCDIKNTGKYRIQVKRRKVRPAVEVMLQEAAIGIEVGEVPLLMIRGDKGRWLAVMYAEDWIREVTLNG